MFHSMMVFVIMVAARCCGGVDAAFRMDLRELGKIYIKACSMQTGYSPQEGDTSRHRSRCLFIRLIVETPYCREKSTTEQTRREHVRRMYSKNVTHTHIPMSALCVESRCACARARGDKPLAMVWEQKRPLTE